MTTTNDTRHHYVRTESQKARDKAQALTALPVKVSRRAKQTQLPAEVELDENGVAIPTPAQSQSSVRTPARIRRAKKGKDEDEKRGPSQLPIEDQAGTYLDRYVLEEVFQVDELGRDAFSRDDRIREWSETEGTVPQAQGRPYPD